MVVLVMGVGGCSMGRTELMRRKKIEHQTPISERVGTAFEFRNEQAIYCVFL